MALAKINHLSEKKQIDHVFRKGKTVKNSFFFIKYLDNNCGFWRVAVSISIKALKKANQRNYLKRIITNILREHKEKIIQVDMVIVFSQPILSESWNEIKSQFNGVIAENFINP
jgi:ribonuclease P protein component